MATVIVFVVLFILIVMVLRSRNGETITMPTDGEMKPPSKSIEDLVRAGRKIEAIKLLREETGLGLKDAKDRIDDLFRRR